VKSTRLLAVCALAVAFVISELIAATTATSMSTAAAAFVNSLSSQQRASATFAFDTDERTKWHFIPTEMFPRRGLTLNEMTDTQRKLAYELLKSGLSQRGYLTATQVIELETILRAIEDQRATPTQGAGNRLVRDPGRYFFSVFGTPSARGRWGWRVEGHHVSLHFTVVDGAVVASTPTFFGSNPAEVRTGPRAGLRVLGREEDAARALLLALDATRRATAMIAQAAPEDILTVNKSSVDPLAPRGLTSADMTAEQRKLLMALIDAYASLMAPELAEARLAAIRKSGIETVSFAWAGEAERGKKHYYRVQGPTFLIEYDNTQDDANHIHSVWRDFAGDFGRDVLREHLKAAH
jgi:hypothetical protein